MVRHLLLQAEYFAHPLWDLDVIGTPDVDPRSLSINAELLASLSAWASMYEAGSAESDDTLFMAQGFALASQLQKQLGKGVAVHFYRNAGAPHEAVSKEIRDVEPLDWKDQPGRT